MEATILLADYARVESGKINAMGVGFNSIGLPTSAHAIILLIDVPWSDSNRNIVLDLKLLDEDGNPVSSGENPETGEPQHVGLHADDLQVGRPPGSRPGSPLTIPLCIDIAPGLQLVSGHGYTWRLEIDGESKEHWSRGFQVR